MSTTQQSCRNFNPSQEYHGPPIIPGRDWFKPAPDHKRQHAKRQDEAKVDSSDYFAEEAKPSRRLFAEARVSERYVYFEEEVVKNFLVSRPELAEILLAAVPSIEEFFGIGVGVSLQVLVDHDGEEDTTLFVRIRTCLDVRTALQLKKQFYRTLRVVQHNIIHLPVNFDVEYV